MQGDVGDVAPQLFTGGRVRRTVGRASTGRPDDALGDLALRRGECRVRPAMRRPFGEADYLALQIDRGVVGERERPQLLQMVIDTVRFQRPEQVVVIRACARTRGHHLQWAQLGMWNDNQITANAGECIEGKEPARAGLGPEAVFDLNPAAPVGGQKEASGGQVANVVMRGHRVARIEKEPDLGMRGELGLQLALSIDRVAVAAAALSAARHAVVAEYAARKREIHPIGGDVHRWTFGVDGDAHGA